MDRVEVQAMLDHEDRHWWYRGRRRIVCDELAQLPVGPTMRVLDAGCGSGRLLDELRGYGQVTGLDLNPGSVEIARSRGHEDVVQGPVEELPWPDATFDLVISLDMVEHTADDRVTLRELGRVTKPGGRFLMTVPALRALWSSHDIFNNHHRRYDRPMMRALAADTGWTIERMTYFNSLLLPPAAAVRLTQRLRHRRAIADGSMAEIANGVDHGQHGSDVDMTPDWMSPVLEFPMKLEASWLRGARRSLPAGLSLLAIMRR
ncbi:MAG TPA: class I SAM-dependent methyltransferase [Conexibacter sp.]|nr:class I SAM-dependent methyltransferase [Conexibacter sp.]